MDTAERAHRLFPDNADILKLLRVVRQRAAEKKKSTESNAEKSEATESEDMEIDDDDSKMPDDGQPRRKRKRSAMDLEAECIRRHEAGPKGSRFHLFCRFTGHCNLKTDIKEATFFGDRFVCSGSDDGRCFLWDKESGKLVNVLSAVDEEVVNTVRRHPHFPVLALSGIDSTVKIWAPSTPHRRDYVDRHRIPFTNHQSAINRRSAAGDDDDDWKNDEEAEHGMSDRRMSAVIEQNQTNLANPPSQRIDLSTLLFWANLMNQ